MPRTAFKCLVDFKLQAISCPGVWLPNKDDVYVSVCILGQHRRTPLVSSVFPLTFYTEMEFSKVFWTAVDPSDVIDKLEREHVYIELVQLDLPSSGTVLAKFEQNLRDFLFPYPSIAPKVLRDRDVLMEKTIDFPNGISPRLEFSCTTTIRETPTPYTDAYESAITGLDDIRIRVPSSRRSYSRSVSPAPRPHRCDLDHIGCTYRPTHDYSADFADDSTKEPFVVRKVDKDLIHRVPGAPANDPFPTSVDVEYKPRSRSRSRSQNRSTGSNLRSRSLSPSPAKRGLYGVYDAPARAATPDPTVGRVSRRSYLDDDDAADTTSYRARSASPSYYEKLKKQLEDDAFNRRVELRVREILADRKYPYYPYYYYPYYPHYYYPYSSYYRYRYPYTSYHLDRLAADLARARVSKYYP